MTPALSRSFAEQKGMRGIHFCDETDCRFANWQEVLEFCHLSRVDDSDSYDEFEEKLLHTMMAINPDNEYAVVRQMGTAVHIECYRAIN